MQVDNNCQFQSNVLPLKKATYVKITNYKLRIIGGKNLMILMFLIP